MELGEDGGIILPRVLVPISGLQSQAGWYCRKGQGVQAMLPVVVPFPAARSVWPPAVGHF